MKDIYEIMNYIKGQKCSLEELQLNVKKLNENAKIIVVGNLNFLVLGTSKAIIDKSKYDNEWYIL